MTVQNLASEWSALWKPPERLPLSEWAEKNFYLSSEYSNRTGRLRLFGWQREILDSFTDPRVSNTVVKCGTQLIKTLFIQCALAYIIVEDPGPCLLLEPKDDDAKAFSKERLNPMCRDIPLLRRKISAPKARDGSNTHQYKEFPGGSLSLVGTNAPGNMARRSICNLFCDETDKYEFSAGVEGDSIALAVERLATYESRARQVECCSPTVKGRSRIDKSYEKSDKRKPWVPCWKCGEFQILKWAQVKWDNAAPKEERHLSAHYECEHCGAGWDDLQRRDACEVADWRAERPFVGVAGFWISHLYSPWKSLAKIVRQFLDSKDDKQQLQVFINTNLAELWEEEGETPEWTKLYARREPYPFGAEPGRPNFEAVVPRGGLFLTAAVDVQNDRLEYEVAAWGRNKERWSIAYGVIQIVDGTGEPLQSTNQALWLELDKVLAMEWKHEAGSTMPIIAMGIDTGSRPKPVYEFTRRHTQPAYGKAGVRVYPRSVVPVKGSSRESLKIIATISNDDAARKRGGIRIVSIGTGVAKQIIYDALRTPKWNGHGPAPHGYHHFPQYDESYFTGLCSEKRVEKDNGDIVWEKQGRNEPLDIGVYNEAMAVLVGIDRFTELHWQVFEKSLGIIAEEPQEPKPPQAPAEPGAVVKMKRRRGFRGFTTLRG